MYILALPLSLSLSLYVQVHKKISLVLINAIAYTVANYVLHVMLHR